MLNTSKDSVSNMFSFDSCMNSMTSDLTSELMIVLISFVLKILVRRRNGWESLKLTRFGHLLACIYMYIAAGGSVFVEAYLLMVFLVTPVSFDT